MKARGGAAENHGSRHRDLILAHPVCAGLPARGGRRWAARPATGRRHLRLERLRQFLLHARRRASPLSARPRRSSSGRTSARPSAWRAASTSTTGCLLTAATSTSVSRIVPRSRIETCSRSSCCNTFCTSPRVISLGTSSSSSFGWRLAQAVQQALGLVPGEQLVRVLPDEFGQMGRQAPRFDRRPRIRPRWRCSCAPEQHPLGGNAEGRLARLLAGKPRRRGVGADRQHASPPCISQRAISTPRR